MIHGVKDKFSVSYFYVLVWRLHGKRFAAAYI